MPPITVLNVAEKPSVARALASVFARMPGAQDQPMTRDVHQIFVQENVCFPSVYSQGRGQMMNGNQGLQSHTMITTSVRGHLASQDFASNYGWNKCRHVALFSAPIETYYSPDMQPLEGMLRQQARRAQALILWLDCDREGEAIGDEVQIVCLASNPRLKVYRAKFSTVMPQEIQRALRSLGTLNEHFVQAVQARTTLDLRVGAAFTRFQTMRLQRKFDIEGVVSYGPCQFPTLGFVVERWARIETFVPEDFWVLQLSIRVDPDNEGGGAEEGAQRGNNNNAVRPIHFTWKRTRLYDRAVTMALYDSCLDAGEAIVTDMSGRPKHRWRPVPLATVELQKRASKFLRIGAEQVMTAAEGLYNNGFISYPRTETEKFRPEFQHQPIIQEFANLGQGNEFAA
jgi:DNA topoisomerase-3